MVIFFSQFLLGTLNQSKLSDSNIDFCELDRSENVEMVENCILIYLR